MYDIRLAPLPFWSLNFMLIREILETSFNFSEDFAGSLKGPWILKVIL